MDISAMKQRAAEEGHNPWLETITALAEVEQRLASVEAEHSKLAERLESIESTVGEMFRRVAALEAAKVAPASGGVNG